LRGGCGVLSGDRGALYPNATHTWVDVEGLDRHLCGAARPGHFRGVCTVVAKLWGLVRPDVGLFGEKDFQQLAILKRMHAELNLVGEVVGLPIVREADGLAMSSRNVNLKGSARQAALAIPRYLSGGEGAVRDGERDAATLLGDAAGSWRRGGSTTRRSWMRRSCSRWMSWCGRRCARWRCFLMVCG
jgi:pantoate--beta-alanine ligase